jgi:acetoin utilization protein AcuC
MKQPLFIGSEIYRGSSYGRAHPLAVPRVPTIVDLARALGWLPKDQYRTSPRAKPAALVEFHTRAYIDALITAEKTQHVTDDVRKRHGLGTLSNPIYPEMFRRPATGVGGAMLAAGLVRHGGVVHQPGGGTHHGMPDRANGFCYLNDPVFAIKALQKQGLKKILYVDIDAHHCDGVEQAFHGATDVRLMSIHEERRWPMTGALEDDAGGAAINLPVPRGFHDDDFAFVQDVLVLPFVQDFAPEAVVLQCGADALNDDPMSRLCLSPHAYLNFVDAMRKTTPRLIVQGGGGYNPWSVGRLWTCIWARLNGIDIPERLPKSAEQILRGLSWSHRLGRSVPETWYTTLLEPPRFGAISQQVRDRVAYLREKNRP